MNLSLPRWTCMLIAVGVFTASASTADTPPPFLLTIGSPGSGPGQLDHPFGLAFDSVGNLWVANEYNARVDKFSPAGSPLGSLVSEEMSRPVGLVVNATGEILVTDHFASHVVRFAADGSVLGTFGTGHLSNPVGIALGPTGEIYVANYVGDGVARFDATGGFIGGWSGRGSGPGQFLGAYGIAVDAVGAVYVSDWGNSRIQVFTATGDFLREFGKGHLSAPDGVAFDTDGGVLVADHGNSRIVKFSLSGDVVWVLGGPGSGPGQFGSESPADVRVSSDGNLYASDWTNGRIQVFGADRIPPPPLAYVTGNIASGTAAMFWPASNASDFDHYAIYRAYDGPPAIDAAHRIGVTTVAGFADAPGAFAHYAVTVLDGNGNESIGTPFVPANPADVESRQSPRELTVHVLTPPSSRGQVDLSIGVPSTSAVVVDVLDAQGRRVRQLVDGQFAAGWATVRWDGKDTGGSLVAPGMYFAQVRTDRESQVTRCVLLR